MKFSFSSNCEPDQIIALFASAFADAEGEEEGAVIRRLVENIYAKTDEKDLFVFCVLVEGELAGAIMFTRMWYGEDNRTVFLLSPVAVKTSFQGRGLGQKLLNHGLECLRSAGVDMVLSYGNPDYYGKVGFQSLTQDMASPPHKLNHPHGWIGQSLQQEKFVPLRGPGQCVEAFEDPAYW